jgi:mono/diheme cytochrome c family protein
MLATARKLMERAVIGYRTVLRGGCAGLLVGGLALTAAAADGDSEADAAHAKAREAAQKEFKDEVAPFIETHCIRCHGEKKKKAGVTFEYAVKNPGSPAFRSLWQQAAQNIKSHDMPPEKEEKQPDEKQRAAIVAWVADIKHLSSKDPGVFIIRRLNKREYGNTLHDLVGVDPAITADLPDEVFGAGYANSLSPLLMEQYLGIANEVLARTFAPAGKPMSAVQRQIIGDLPVDAAAEPAAAERVARSFARRAFRRPPSDDEVGVLMKVYQLARSKGRSYPEAVRLLVKAVLISPQFLFITPDGAVESGDGRKSPDIVPLDDHQLASRLSYFLWATMPDAELSALADAGKLHDPAVLAVQTRRLLSDPRSRALFDGFGAQWLGLEKLATKTFDAAKFPQMTPALRSAMYEEGRLLFDSILRENRPLLTFIDCDYTFVNETLAPVYGLANVHGEQMRTVTLTDANRGGILTMPGVLAMSSFPNRTSAVNRGVWVLEQVLGEHVPPPPANVPALDKQDQKKVANLTLRQRTELHRTDPVCASCHKVLDPIGFGLENFDAIGRWRDQDDSGGAIDASGELPGGHHFSAPKELKAIIKARGDDLCRSLTGKLLAYSLCRQLEGYDEIVIDQLTAAIAKDGNRFQSLVVAVTTSYPFTHRRIGEQPGQSHAK